MHGLTWLQLAFGGAFRPSKTRRGRRGGEQQVSTMARACGCSTSRICLQSTDYSGGWRRTRWILSRSSIGAIANTGRRAVARWLYMLGSTCLWYEPSDKLMWARMQVVTTKAKLSDEAHQLSFDGPHTSSKFKRSVSAFCFCYLVVFFFFGSC